MWPFKKKKPLPWKEVARLYRAKYLKLIASPVKVVHHTVEIDTTPHVDLNAHQVFTGRRTYRVIVQFPDGNMVEFTAKHLVEGRVLSGEDMRKIIPQSKGA